MRLLRNAVVYFLIVFAAGWVLGPIRIFIVQPALGSMAAVSIEAPIMILVSWLAARRVFGAGYEAGALAAAGLIALSLLIGAEYASAVLLRHETAMQFFAGFANPEGFITLDAFLAYSLMPILAARWGVRT
jgi:hypothetical protein